MVGCFKDGVKPSGSITNGLLRDLRFQPRCKWDRRSSAWRLKIGPVGYTETSVTTNLRFVTSQKSDHLKLFDKVSDCVFSRQQFTMTSPERSCQYITEEKTRDQEDDGWDVSRLTFNN